MKSFQAFRALARPQRVTSSRAHRVLPTRQSYRLFHASCALQKIETHILSDIGEGVKEVQIIQWFVEEGAAVEEWAPLCEVQSDKASVEITSKFSGIVKKLRYERDAVVQVGDAMLDIEVEGEDEPETHEETSSTQESQEESKEPETSPREDIAAEEGSSPPESTSTPQTQAPARQSKTNGKHGSLATPAVRGLLKQHNVNVEEVQGTGRDGRVLKEDVLKHIENGKRTATTSSSATSTSAHIDAKQSETAQSLTAIQSAMFKSMTKSLNIPHFLYSDKIDITTLASMRKRLNETRKSDTTPKLSYMPFVIKAVSLAMNKYPILNARLDTSDTSKPKLQMRSSHNIGVAMDTPAGLLVPVIKNVNARSISSIAEELQRLAQLGAAGKLGSNDISGGTITVSNIGNIGGDTVAPVIVEGQLAIMGMGKIKATPVFAEDGITVKRADLMSTSWSADHRVIDGATMARAATVVQGYLERPETMIVDMS